LEDQHAGVTGKGALEDAAKEAAKDVVKAAPKGAAPGLPKPFPELAEPHVLVSGAAGIATTARESTQQYSENHHAISSAGHVGLSAGDSVAVSARESIRLFAFKGGLRLTAFGRKLELQAVKSSLLLRAKVDIVQTSQEIEIQAKSKVLLNGAGSFRRWDGSITTGTKGRWMVYAADYGFKPGNKLPVPVLPNYSGTLKEDKPKGDLLFTLLAHAQDGAPVPHEPYTLLKGGAQVAKGVTDALGQVVIKDHDPATTQYTVKLADGRVYDLGVEKALDSIPKKATAQGFRAAQGDSSKRNDEFYQAKRPKA
jgi:type VI secretion system secreted protein VgrG